MNSDTFNRLHVLRMENDAAKYAMDEIRPRFDTMKNRKENGTAPRAVVVHQLFQTPKIIAEMMVAKLRVEEPGARILEPSAGLGRLLDELKHLEPSEVVAVEIAQDCCRELFHQTRKSVTLMQRDFLAVDPEEVGAFDAVCMNPPFTMGSDVRHIQHAYKFLEPGGRLVSLCMDGVKQNKLLKPWVEALGGSWERLPGRSFKESGTGIDVVMLAVDAQ